MVSTKFKLTVHFHFLLNQAKLALYNSVAQNIQFRKIELKNANEETTEHYFLFINVEKDLKKFI